MSCASSTQCFCLAQSCIMLELRPLSRSKHVGTLHAQGQGEQACIDVIVLLLGYILHKLMSST